MKKFLRKILSLTLLFSCLNLSLTPDQLMALPKLNAGAQAPQFTLNDAESKPISLEAFKGAIVVLEWTNPNCPFVRRHYTAGTMKKLATEYTKQGVKWLAIDSSKTATAETIRDWVSQQKIEYPVLSDSSGKVGKLYEAETTPHIFIIDAQGKLAYQGSVDDDPYGEATQNYIERALSELVAGKAVSQPQTKAYGCSVKYAN